MKLFLWPFLLLASSSAVYAANDIYEYTDTSGNTVVSNINKDKQAKKVTLPPLNIYAAPMSKADVYAAGYTENKVLLKPVPPQMLEDSALYFTTAQNKTRTAILQEELDKEEISLVDSKKLLTLSQNIKSTYVSGSNADSVKILQDSIVEHEKNIELLKKELNNNITNHSR